MSENQQKTLLYEAKNLCFYPEGIPILHDISLRLKRGETLAIAGPSGSGKTTLGKLMSGQLQATSGQQINAQQLSVLMVDQQDHFMSLSGQRSTYYGQRYENQGMDDTPTVREYLVKVAGLMKITTIEETVDQVINILHINRFEYRKLLQLSNGERKRTQLAAALLQHPDILILDQPFVGLDSQSRQHLSTLLEQLKSGGTDLVIICSSSAIPSCSDQVIELDAGRMVQQEKAANFAPKANSGHHPRTADIRLLKLIPGSKRNFSNIIRMKDVHVLYNEQKVLTKINWIVKTGERWALTGPNGAGKTTLLSLVTADNPQGYTNDLLLFDRQRGSGESIWDIKKKIGFVSPELHQYFLRGDGIYNTIPGLNSFAHSKYDSLSCTDVILSGFNDEIGFVSSATDHQREIALTWLGILGLAHLGNSCFLQASLGEQRLLLLARALVKSPDLLILDEPCQGLDDNQTSWFTGLLDSLCRELPLTLIYVSHYTREIPKCVDHLLELGEGAIVYCGQYERSV